MTRAGAGFVPCEVPCPARVLTAYPCVVRWDPTVSGTFPSESKSETVSPGWLGEEGWPRCPRSLSCSSHTVGQQARLPVSAHGLAMSVGRPAYVPAMRVAGRDYVTSSGTKQAPARVMASATGQPSYDRIM